MKPNFEKMNGLIPKLKKAEIVEFPLNKIID